MEQLISKNEIIDLCGGLDNYNNFDHLQIREIMSGYVNGLRKDEIDRYSNPNLTYIEMRKEKDKLLIDAEPNFMLKELREYLLLVNYYLKKMDEQNISLKNIYKLFVDERKKYKRFGYNKNRQINVILECEEDIINNLYALAYAGYLCEPKKVEKIDELKTYLYKMK